MKHILVVDDDSALRGFLKKALIKNGHKVIEASDGEDAIAILDTQADNIHLVLTDIVMPNINGTELASHIQKHYAHIKIMFMTGFSAMELNGKDNHPHIKTVSKPFHLNDIVKRVNIILSQ
jgi:two-component system cell cycle response regulator CpdR